MTGAERKPGQGSPTVSAATIPLLFLGLVIGFFAGYFLLWWGVLVVIALSAAAFAAVMAGKSRDAATAAILGVVAGYGILVLLAIFRGVL